MTGNSWAYLATAPDQITAEIWVDILRNAGLAAMVHPSDAVSFMGVSARGCRVQVQEHDIETARELLGAEETQTP
jgi:hypothetical protein